MVRPSRFIGLLLERSTVPYYDPGRWLQQSPSAATFNYGNTYCDDRISKQRFLFDWLGEVVQSLHSMSGLNPRIRTLLVNVSGMVPRMQRNAEMLDTKAEFPRIELEDLRAAGALSAVVPQRLGGLGLGTEPSGALGAFELLRLIGRGSLAVGRIFEGHMNALRLISLYGHEEQLRRAADDTRAGHLFSIWNTERPPEAVRIVGTPVAASVARIEVLLFRRRLCDSRPDHCRDRSRRTANAGDRARAGRTSCFNRIYDSRNACDGHRPHQPRWTSDRIRATLLAALMTTSASPHFPAARGEPAR